MQKGNDFLSHASLARISHWGQHIAVLDSAGVGSLSVRPTMHSVSLERETSSGSKLLRVGWSDDDSVIMAAIGRFVHFYAFDGEKVTSKYRCVVKRVADEEVYGLALSPSQGLFAYAGYEDCDCTVYVYDWAGHVHPVLIHKIFFSHNYVKDMEFAWDQPTLCVVTARGTGTFAIP